MSSSSIRNMFSVMFFLIAMTPIFSMIEFRDTTQLPQCDTIIDKKGVVSYVKISDLTKTIIKYTLCNDTSKRVYIRNLDYIQDIKSKTSFKKFERKSLLTIAKTASQLIGIGVLVFMASVLGFFASLDGSHSSNFLIILSLIIGTIGAIIAFVGFFWCMNILSKAKQEGNKKAANLARSGIIIMSLLLLLLFSLFL
jgi:lysylphosphatidylglycerol synthetase-like protein (DUF2156 family)